jgi:CRP-like cAMP-binding protein
MVGGLLETVVRALERSDLFASLRDDQLRKVAARGELWQCAQGDVVVTEGDPSTSFFLVLSGAVTVRIQDREVGKLGPSDVVGEMGVLLGKTRTATVIVDSPTVLLSFDAQVFRMLFERIPGFGMAIGRALAQRLETTTKRAS